MENGRRDRQRRARIGDQLAGRIPPKSPGMSPSEDKFEPGSFLRPIPLVGQFPLAKVSTTNMEATMQSAMAEPTVID
jgi:hypothetical protein